METVQLPVETVTNLLNLLSDSQDEVIEIQIMTFGNLEPAANKCKSMREKLEKVQLVLYKLIQPNGSS